MGDASLFEYLANLSDADRASLLAEINSQLAKTKFHTIFPDEGPYRRELYPKHMAFIAAGKEHKERAFIAGNRVGKTLLAAYESTAHLTGDYPEWWPGHVFKHPVDVWAAGDTSETTRDIIQLELFGRVDDLGTGMLPAKNLLGNPTMRRSVANAIDTATIKHKSGGVSFLGLKSYDQGRVKFQGTSKDFCWCDEEPPKDVYDEILLRTMTKDGLVICTFTPLKGLSEVALAFLPHLAPTPLDAGAQF